MTAIVRRDPFLRMRQIMDRLFDDPFFRSQSNGLGLDEGTLPVDIYESDGALKVTASLPGFAKDDVDVQVHEGVLSIKAEHTENHETTGERFYRRERRVGSVSRRIALPGIVRDAEVEAGLRDGVLTLTLPLPEKARPTQIEIHTN